MAKTIEQTPTLKGKDATRFFKILESPNKSKPSSHEIEVKELVNKLPKNLKF